MTGQDEQHLVQPPKFRIPWPTRLAKSAFELSLFGILIGILTVVLNVGFLFVVALGIMIASAVFALVSFGGLLFYRFKVPGLGKCIWTMIILYPVFAIGLAIVQPALSRAKVVAGTILCKSNISQLHLAFVSYQRENGVWPTKSSWSDLIKETLSSPDAFQCPTGKLGPCSYAMNAAIPDGVSDLPPALVLLFESAPGWNPPAAPPMSSPTATANIDPAPTSPSPTAASNSSPPKTSPPSAGPSNASLRSRRQVIGSVVRPWTPRSPFTLD